MRPFSYYSHMDSGLINGQNIVMPEGEYRLDCITHYYAYHRVCKPATSTHMHAHTPLTQNLQR